jgi:serine phosphatase RsbU (regulator of sigma subunit)
MRSEPIRSLQAAILLVEDNAADARLVEEYLDVADARELKLDHCEDLAEALRRLARKRYDLVLLDLNLSDSVGLDSLRRIQAASPGTPVVVLAGVEALKLGAEDFLAKNRLEAPMFVRAVRYALERAARRKVEHDLETAHEDLRAARQIQQSLYPRIAPELPGYDISGVSFPCQEVGGDYYDFITLPDGALGIAVGDASGHGLGASLLMAEVRATLRALIPTCPDLGELLTVTNRLLSDGLLDGLFISLFFAQLDYRRHILTYASAGHPTGLVFGRGGRLRCQLCSTGCPLGVLPEEKYCSAGELALESGDLMLLYSDGLLEAGLPHGEPWGADRLVELVGQHHESTTPALLRVLQNDVTRHCLPTTPVDDITMVALKVE